MPAYQIRINKLNKNTYEWQIYSNLPDNDQSEQLAKLEAIFCEPNQQ